MRDNVLGILILFSQNGKIVSRRFYVYRTTDSNTSRNLTDTFMNMLGSSVAAKWKSL